MKNITRRDFIGKTSTVLGGTFLLSQFPSWVSAQALSLANDIPLGFQAFTIREMMGKDFAGTLKTMAGFGYKVIELCSPPGYSKMGFGFLENMKAAEIKKIINEAGLSCPSCHYGYGEFTKDLDARIEFAQQLGLSQMICSTFWLPKTAGLKDYQDAADTLNKAAEKIKKAGMQAGFHNHSMEFAMLGGELIYDALLQRFDPDLVKMQFQTEVINLGYKASTYFTKYPGRFISAHLSDWTSDKKQVPVGQGIIDWKEFFAAAKTGGVKNIFVEMDFATFKDSAAYVKNLS
jgi:sugar phosphate isomerase/epimerase